MGIASKGTAIGAVALGVLALLLPAWPAQAGPVSWEDPVGDVRLFVAPSVLPTDASLDLTRVTLVSNGTSFDARLDVESLGGLPVTSTGYYFGVVFMVGGQEFMLRVVHDRLGGGPTTFLHRRRETETFESLPCRDCSSRLDTGASVVTLSAPVMSLRRGIAASGMATLNPGERIAVSRGTSGRRYQIATGYQYYDADQAPAPRGTILVP